MGTLKSSVPTSSFDQLYQRISPAVDGDMAGRHVARLCARVLDIVSAGFAADLLFGVLKHYRIEVMGESDFSVIANLVFKYSYIAITISLLLLILLESWLLSRWGFTLGKRVCGLRVCDSRRQNLSFQRAFVRTSVTWAIIIMMAIAALNQVVFVGQHSEFIRRVGHSESIFGLYLGVFHDAVWLPLFRSLDFKVGNTDIVFVAHFTAVIIVLISALGVVDLACSSSVFSRTDYGAIFQWIFGLDCVVTALFCNLTLWFGFLMIPGLMFFLIVSALRIIKQAMDAIIGQIIGL